MASLRSERHRVKARTAWREEGSVPDEHDQGHCQLRQGADEHGDSKGVHRTPPH